MRYDFDHVPDRRPTDSIKWNKYQADVIPLWVADMDYIAAEPIQRALRVRIEHGVYGYPDTHSSLGMFSELRDVLVERMQRLYNWQISADDLLFLPGVITGLNLTCHAVAEPGGNVLVQTPVYPPFLNVAQNAEMECNDVEMEHRNGHYEIDWEAFEGRLNKRTKLFILCNPHNPVGRVFRRDELKRMAEICLRNGVVICSDEIHCDLLYKGKKHLPIASLDAEIANNTVTLMSPTKTFNIAGLQCSFAIVQNQALRKKLEQAMKGMVMWVNLIGLTAALAAYREGQEWLEQALHYMEGNRNYLYECVRDQLPMLQMVKPEGTYLAWLDCRNAGIQGSPYEFFLKEARVGLNDGATFGGGGEGFVRLNFACSWVLLTMALERMKSAIDRAGE
jgi:cysteine-S-conjugate beta-lyase